ncbi:hypothetical protein HH213_08580 [Duganella dendranthematis]|uniref:Uncharacterized protein n=1 Tax=Duganella dendranthematis TaxID=2728021 RepID=A0ABX6M749_9BURK|nr:hypothetical protein [Duganella dendranthematis]QJD90146.1 hypothetical protein HH213_08580 [Duganella dendranthematis]
MSKRNSGLPGLIINATGPRNSRSHVNSKLLWRQFSFTLVAVQIAEPTGGSDIGGGVAAAILSCAEMLSCALTMAGLFDGEILFGGEMVKFG